MFVCFVSKTVLDSLCREMVEVKMSPELCGPLTWAESWYVKNGKKATECPRSKHQGSRGAEPRRTEDTQLH